MISKRVLVVFVLISSFLIHVGMAQQPRNALRNRLANALPEGVTVYRDLEFAQAGDLKLLLDLYVPTDPKEAPLVVWIHGGGWRAGCKGNAGRVRHLLDHGYAVADINYRLTHEAIFPAQIYDCKAAIRWLRAHAEKYGYDAKRIGVAGSSAGGHLAALLGTSGGVKELEGTLGNHLDQSSGVQAVCDMWGPSDFSLIVGVARGPRSPEVLLLGGTVSEKQEAAALASPVTHITKDDPPFLIIHGDQDRVVGLRQSETLKKSLDEAKVPCKLEVLEGAAHGGRGYSIEKVNEMVLTFFDKQLKGKE